MRGVNLSVTLLQSHNRTKRKYFKKSSVSDNESNKIVFKEIMVLIKKEQAFILCNILVETKLLNNKEIREYNLIPIK